MNFHIQKASNKILIHIVNLRKIKYTTTTASDKTNNNNKKNHDKFKIFDLKLFERMKKYIAY